MLPAASTEISERGGSSEAMAVMLPSRCPDEDGLVVRSVEPLNAETPLRRLVEHSVTPVEFFFVRNHGPVPRVDEAGYRLRVEGLVETELTLSMRELRERFPSRTVTAALQCAGNRRCELMAVRPITDELAWGEGAVGNARWTGVPLRELLLAAGVRPGVRHVAFTGLDRIAKPAGRIPFGASVPLEKAIDDVLLAYEMNGEPLTARHGYPLRVVVPGCFGARSVKWLERITVRRQPSTNHYQARSYRLAGKPLGELPVNSVICRPGQHDRLRAGQVTVEGYALTGGRRSVQRVEVSSDGGRTWTPAHLSREQGRSTWRLWRARLELSPGIAQIAVRALDSSASAQPEDPARLWNQKGYANNAWHRVTVYLKEGM